MRALKITLFVLLSYFACATFAWSGETEIRTSIAQLATAKNFPEIEKIVKELAALGDPMNFCARLVAAALNDARGKADAAAAEAMRGATGELQLPPGFKMPF